MPDARETSDRHWFEPIARHLGPAYWAPGTGRVMAFTKGTDQEVGFLVGHLGLTSAHAVLDVGCGPGRHALALAARGIDVTGVDISQEFVALATAAARQQGVDDRCRFLVGDVRQLAFTAEFDVVISLCQGGFGLQGGGPGGSLDADIDVIARMARAIRPGGRLVVSAFSAYFAARHLEPDEELDLTNGVLHEVSNVRGPDNEERPFDLWTTLFTARELRLGATTAGLRADGVYGVTPGNYGARPPTIDDPELLLVATRVATSA